MEAERAHQSACAHACTPEISKVNCPVQTPEMFEHFGRTFCAAPRALAGRTDEYQVSFLFSCLVMPVSSFIPCSVYLLLLRLLQCLNRLS